MCRTEAIGWHLLSLMVLRYGIEFSVVVSTLEGLPTQTPGQKAHTLNKYASSAERPSAPTIHHVIMPGRGQPVGVSQSGGSASGGRLSQLGVVVGGGVQPQQLKQAH